MIDLNLIILFVSLTGFFLAVLFWFRWLALGKNRFFSQRLEEFSVVQNPQQSENYQITRSEDLSRIPFFNRLLKSLDVSARLRRLIEQADLSIKVGELTLMMLVLAGVGLLITLKSEIPVLMLSVTFFFGGSPLFYVLFRQKRRIKQFEDQFPDAIDIMKNAIRAGFALSKAMQLAATESPDPVGVEFKKTFEEIKLGQSMKTALLNLGGRVNSLDLKLFIAALLIQKESGGNLTEILTKISKTIRARFKLAGQIRVFTAQGRLSSWILGGLPIGVAVIVSLFNPEYIGLLFSEPLGRTMIGFGLGLQILGFILISRIVKIKMQ